MEVHAEESSVSEEEEASVGIVVDSDDLKEKVSADTEGIDGPTEEDSLSQEKPAAPSSITIEDSLLEASAHEAYPESTLEEKSIPEDRKEVVEEAPQAVDLEEEQPSDSANAELTKEKILSQEKPAASTPIPSKIPGTEADVFEVHHILDDKERSISEEKSEGIERTFEAVGLETEPLSDSSGPAKEEPRFQEILMPSLMSSEDSKVNTGEEKHHQKPAAEEDRRRHAERGHRRRRRGRRRHHGRRDRLGALAGRRARAAQGRELARRRPGHGRGQRHVRLARAAATHEQDRRHDGDAPHLGRRRLHRLPPGQYHHHNRQPAEHKACDRAGTCIPES